MSGEAYLIKFRDGTTLTLEKWFRKQLNSVKKLPEEPADIDKQ